MKQQYSDSYDEEQLKADLYNDEDEYEDDTLKESEDDKESEEILRELIRLEMQDDPWAIYKLNEEYKDESFDEEKALTLLWNTNDNGEPIVKDQEEAVRYANYFAKNGSNDAKNFIIRIIQDEKDPEKKEFIKVGAMAKTSFYLFFRNYIRIAAKNYLNRQPISEKEKNERMGEMIDNAFYFIYKNLDKYDPSIAQINTFFGEKQLLGAFFECEATRKGYPSRQMFRKTLMVVREKQRLEKEGIDPDPGLIAQRTGLTLPVVKTALYRASVEGSVYTLDTPEIANSGGPSVQCPFDTPEQKAVADAVKEELIANINLLTDDEREILLMHLGLYCDGIEFNDVTKHIVASKEGDDGKTIKTEKDVIHAMDFTEIEKKTGINKDEAKKIYQIAILKLKNAYKLKNMKQKFIMEVKAKPYTFDSGRAETEDIDDIFSVNDDPS